MWRHLLTILAFLIVPAVPAIPPYIRVPVDYEVSSDQQKSPETPHQLIINFHNTVNVNGSAISSPQETNKEVSNGANGGAVIQFINNIYVFGNGSNFSVYGLDFTKDHPVFAVPSGGENDKRVINEQLTTDSVTSSSNAIGNDLTEESGMTASAAPAASESITTSIGGFPSDDEDYEYSGSGYMKLVMDDLDVDLEKET